MTTVVAFAAGMAVTTSAEHGRAVVASAVRAGEAGRRAGAAIETDITWAKRLPDEAVGIRSGRNER